MDWEAIDIVSQRCNVNLHICKSTKDLLDEGCTVPFICRYRANQIENASPEIIREVNSQLLELQEVEAKALRILHLDEKHRKNLCQLQKQTGLEKKEDILLLEKKVLPESARILIKKCTTAEELQQVVELFKPSSKNKISKAEYAKEAGLEVLVEKILIGEGQYITQETVSSLCPKTILAWSQKEFHECITDLLADFMAKSPELFDIIKHQCLIFPPQMSCRKKLATNEKKKNSTSSSSPVSTGSDREPLSNDICMKEKNSLHYQRTIKHLKPENFEQYFNLNIPVTQLHAHQVLAINRAEKAKILQVSISFSDAFMSGLFQSCRTGAFKAIFNNPIHSCVEDQHLFFTTQTKLFDQVTLRCIFETSMKKSWNHLAKRQLIRKIRRELTKKAIKTAVDTFASNLKSLLLSPCLSLPESSGCILGIDPGFSHGSKWAVIHCRTDTVLKTGVFYLLSGSQLSKLNEKKTLMQLLNDYPIWVIAIGDGTGSHETELMFSEIIQSNSSIKCHYRKRSRDTHSSSSIYPILPCLNSIKYMIVNEKGTSIWSVTKDAEDELPEYPPEIRSAISIARRLMNPLAEYIKVEPQHLGIGLYQHSIPNNRLQEALLSIIQECVTLVGVELNTAPLSLLKYVAGLGMSQAKAIIDYRENHGYFKSRMDLLKVKHIGPKTFEQCIGFLRIHYSPLKLINDTHPLLNKNIALQDDIIMETKQSFHLTASISNEIIQPIQSQTQDIYMNDANISSPLMDSNISTVFSHTNDKQTYCLDSTWIHPEYYPVTEKLILLCGTSMSLFGTDIFKEHIMKCFPSDCIDPFCHYSKILDIDIDTVQLIVNGLLQGYIDIRDTLLNEPLFQKNIYTFSDLACGMEITGRVSNITPFGIFVNIGIKKDGLLHRHQITPNQLTDFKLGQIIHVVVHNIDNRRQRVALTLSPILASKDISMTDKANNSKKSKYDNSLSSLELLNS